jgi:hypothetical protein
VGVAIFLAAAVATLVWLMILGRGLTFFYDEWDFINAAATTGYWHNVLQPHNGHPSMVLFSVYWALLHTVGLRHYWPYQLVLVLLDVLCGWLLFVLLRRKVHPAAAAAAAAALMLLGSAWQDLLWPFQIGWFGSVAGGLGALVLLDRNARRSDVGACACLLLSIGFSGVGLPFLAGVGIELMWRRRDRQRLWVPGFPLALFVVWYGTIGRQSTTSVSLTTMLRTMTDATTATVGILAGRGTAFGTLLSCVLAVLVVVVLLWSPGRAARLAMALTGLFTFWVLTLLARGVSLTTSQGRYLYPASVFILLAIGEIVSLIPRLVPLPPDTSPQWVRGIALAATVGIVAYAGLAIWWNSGSLTDGRNGLLRVSSRVRPELGAVVLAGSALPPNFRPDPAYMPQVSVGPFLRAVTAFGSPAEGKQEITASGQASTSTLDTLLLRGRPIRISRTADLPISAAGECERYNVTVSSQVPVFTLPRGGVRVSAPRAAAIAIQARSLSRSFPSGTLDTIPPGETRSIEWSAQPTSIRWQVALTTVPLAAIPGSTVTVCPVPAKPDSMSQG